MKNDQFNDLMTMLKLIIVLLLAIAIFILGYIIFNTMASAYAAPEEIQAFIDG